MCVCVCVCVEARFSKVITIELGYAERCYPCASSWDVYRGSFNFVNNVNNGRGRRFLNEGHCVDGMTHGIAHPPFRILYVV